MGCLFWLIMDIILFVLLLWTGLGVFLKVALPIFLVLLLVKWLIDHL